MTKKRMMSLVRAIFWYLILLLPLICYVCTCLSDQPNVAFTEFMSNFTVTGSNPVYTFINGLFGSSGQFPALSAPVVSYFTYFVCVEFLHVILDLVLFLPTLLHGALDKITRKDGDM